MNMNTGRISRVTRSKEDARVNYDRLSSIYDLLTGWSEGPLRRAGIRALGPAEGERILEIGFGTGASLVELGAAVGVSGVVHGIDLSPGMLARASARVEKAGLAKRVRLFQGDAAAWPEEMPQDKGVYDAVFLSFTLELFDTPEIPIVLAACSRALRPGGRICVVSLSKRGSGLALRLYAWAHARFPVLVDCRPIYPVEALEEAGFEVCDAMARRMFGLPVEIVVGRKGDS